MKALVLSCWDCPYLSSSDAYLALQVLFNNSGYFGPNLQEVVKCMLFAGIDLYTTLLII